MIHCSVLQQILLLAALSLLPGCSKSVPAPSSAETIDAQFHCPDSRYRPFVRWWWNGDRVEKDELMRELEVMKAAGIGGVEISPIAMPSGADTVGKRALTWLSDEWIDCVQAVLDKTRELDMGCDLLVGSGWPFGSESLKMDERASVLIALAEKLTGGSRYETTTEEIITRSEPLVTIKNKDCRAEIVSLLLVPDPVGSLAETVELKGTVADGKLVLDVPEGDWYLHSLVRFDSFASVINGAPGAAGSQIDYMNARAIRRYLNNMAGKIEGRIGPLKGRLRAFFVDNMELEGCNWTADFAKEFKRRRGYDIMPWYPFIIYKMGRLGDVSNYKFGGERTPEFRDSVERVRYDFEITRMELNYERYTRTYLDWCRRKGVKSRAEAYGRGFWPLDSSLDYDIPEGESWTTNWLKHRIGEEMGDEDYRRGRAYTMVNKYVSSAAHISGKRLVSAEEMTNTYKVFTTPLEFLKVGSDMAAFSGITHSVWHGFNYSPPEAPFPGWVQYGTFHSERNTWWPYVRLLNDYRARMSSILQNTDMVTPIAILPANGDLWSELGAQNEPFPVRLNTQWTSILWEAVHKNGGGADYLSEGVIRDASVRDGKLVCRTRSYGELFLAEVKGIDDATLDKIDLLVRGGGRVFCVGSYPEKSLGLKDARKRDARVKAVVEALVRDCPERFILLPKPEDGAWLEWYTRVQEEFGLPHDVEISRPDRFLLQNHYRADDGSDYFLIANASFSQSFSEDLGFEPQMLEGRNAFVYDPAAGVRRRIETEGNCVHLDLGPSETVVLSFSTLEGGEEPAPALPHSGETQFSPAAWTVELDNPQVEGTETIELEQLVDLKELRPAFMGTAVYRTVVSIPDGVELPSYLSLGKVGDIAEVTLNGKPAGLRWWGDPVFEIDGLIREGDNTLEIKVTTMMGNYLQTLPDNSVAQRFILRRKQPLVSAGLIGPVRLYSAPLSTALQ